MKFLSIVCTMFLTIGTAFSQEMEIVADYEEGINFDEFETYNWAMSGMENDAGLWITLNDLRSAMIKDALEYELDVSEYKLDITNPDMLINYHIFEEGYDEEAYVGASPYRYRYMNEEAKATPTDIKEGTLVISIIDTESGRAVWEGYASNFIDAEDNLREEQKGIRKAVHGVMSQFKGIELTASR